MRVISGLAKGINLRTPRGLKVRPTSDMVKEAMFSILGSSVTGALVIDLFAGSGALGIEALSRGAQKCVFVERSKPTCRLIKDNLIRAALLEKTLILQEHVLPALRRLGRQGFKADLILMDPPYHDEALVKNTLSEICSSGILKDDGLLVLEHASKNRIAGAGYRLKMQKRYGDTCLTFMNPDSLTKEEFN